MRQTITIQSFISQTTELLVITVTCAMLVWYLQFLWRRRKLYLTSSKLPGPFGLPLIGSLYLFIGDTSDIFASMFRLFSHYPELFKLWFGTKLMYMVSDPKYFAVLLSNHFRKDDLYRMAEPVTGHGLLNAPVEKWRKHRKIIMPTFNQKILDQFLEVFVKQSAVLVEVMKKYSGHGEFDIFALMSRCTLDIICETSMGIKIEAQRTDSHFPIWVDRIMEIILLRFFNIFYHSDVIFNNSALGKEFHKVNNKLQSFTKKIVTDKRIQYEKKIQNTEEKYIEEEMPKRKAFLDLLIEMNYEQEENHRFTDDELLNETITFMMGGSDTTASTNCFTLTMLGMHQDIQNKVLAEILDVVGPDREVQLSDLPQLKYLERVIKESLRLFPVAPFVIRSLDEDVDLGDHILQKGTSVVFGILRTHTNEKYWPDPYKFDPDRFLPEEIAKRNPCSYIPFSFGPRNCIGMKYAMMAMKALMATVLRKYRIQTAYKCVEDIELKLHVLLRPKYGFKLSLELI